MSILTLAAAQLDFKVGDVIANTKRLLEAAQQTQAELIIFPELCLTGYPPEDLLFRTELYQRVQAALTKIIAESHHLPTLVVGYPDKEAGKIYNKVAVISRGKIIATYAKQQLPNYTVFDEQRYFCAGNTPCVFSFQQLSLGLLICEDIWSREPLAETVAAGADLVLIINASPFALDQQQLRESLLKKQAKEMQIPLLYCNLVGAQDELVFDGGSLAINANGEIAQQADFFKESILLTQFDSTTHSFKSQPIATPPSRLEKMYNALVLGLRDYVHKNNFKNVILGLSGGIDSALSLAIAVDALGPEQVKAILMPSRHTAIISNEDAVQEANNLGVSYQIIPIEEAYISFLNTLQNAFQDRPFDLTEQNIQARCRGVILMALSNKFGSLVLTTSNKSEISVGYSTLYGDMAGGFCVLKDVLKTDVYRLAEYRNSLSPAIPQRVIKRAPTAELAENQRDQDSLPPYEILDEIIKLYVEQDQDNEAIIAKGFDAKLVNEVVKKIKLNEYKRRQAPLGIRLNERAFGRDRRYPISSGY